MGKAAPNNKNLLLYLSAALAALVVILFIWKTVAVRSVETRMLAERQSLIENARKELHANTQTLLRLTTIPLTWSVRREMLKDNYDQINEYIVRLVKEPEVKQVIIAKQGGVIAAASDKKLEGSSISVFLSPEDLKREEITLTLQDGGMVRAVAPIMGLNARIGTLLIVYAPAKGAIE